MAQIRSMVVNVATAGTAVRASATDLWVKKAIVRGAAANTGNIFLGNNGAGDVEITNGLVLEPADPPVVLGDIEIGGKDDLINLKDLWVDSSVNNEKLTILYFID
jgi:hypothetical protein